VCKANGRAASGNPKWGHREVLGISISEQGGGKLLLWWLWRFLPICSFETLKPDLLRFWVLHSS
jgi:hypothetical protein